MSLKHLITKSNNDDDAHTTMSLCHLAITGQIEQLACNIFKGVPQDALDRFGNDYTHYLDKEQLELLTRLYNAWARGKLYVHAQHAHAIYMHSVDTDGRPSICRILEGSDTQVLLKLLDNGIDLGNSHVRASAAAATSNIDLLAQYGWIPSNESVLKTVQSTLCKFYDPRVWIDGPPLGDDFSVKLVKHPRTMLRLPNATSVAFISDTHGNHRKIQIPETTLLICSGDVCFSCHKDHDIDAFLEWMAAQKPKYKIFVPGNHDKWLQRDSAKWHQRFLQLNIQCLHDSGTTVNGLKIWGSGWTPTRSGNTNDAFTLSRPELMEKWNMIPGDVDLLITHCPPYGIGDFNTKLYKGMLGHAGDYGLRKTIERLPKLKMHFFGHVHYGRGIYQSDTGIYFVNGATFQVNPTDAYIFGLP